THTHHTPQNTPPCQQQNARLHFSNYTPALKRSRQAADKDGLCFRNDRLETRRPHRRGRLCYPCRRLKRATSRAVSRSTARFFRSALLSRASLPSPTPSSAFSFPFFQYSLRTTNARPLTWVSP